MSNPVAKKQLPAFLVLTIICLVAALALGATNAVTKGPIKEHEMAAQREAFGAVMTADEYIELDIPEGSGVTALVEARVNGETVGYCAVASYNGYASPVAVTLGVGMDGKITGAKIGDTNFAETSGFGSRWLGEGQTDQFIGADLKEGGAIEALSGATVTSTAVLNASNTVAAAINELLGIDRTEPVFVFGVVEKAPVEQMELTGDIYKGTARGFASDVTVELTLDDNGAITGLVIDSSGETAGFGQRCMEETAFAEQFLGKTPVLTLGEDIDALSGATVTSKAVVAAVNAAVSEGEPADDTADEPAVETSTTPADGLTATAQGFQSEVTVTLTMDNGAITSIAVDSTGETTGFGTRCGEDEAFLNQFIGKSAALTLGEDVDALSGATVTSTAVVNAVNSLFAAEPAGEALTASAKGLLSDVTVTITKNDDGTIATITVDCSGETQEVAAPCAEDAFLSQFIGKVGPFENAEVVSGATFTSTAVINALNSLFAAE